MAEEEVLMEVEAVESVYGEDCLVLDSFPPHLHLHIKPRTADVSSQQFVETIIRIRAGPQYPKEPPRIDIIESKGLDEQREKHLITCIREKALELSSSLMLVALCEEAVERLSLMNHPDGNCPLCLYPLVPEDENNETLPFMKLMSCFHCFHSECIIQWWNWLRKEKKSNSNASLTLQRIRDLENQNGMHGVAEESMGICPVCRKVFQAKDLEHVLDLVGAHAHQSGSDGTEVIDDKFLQSDSENNRRQEFEAILKIQQENSGLIEPKRSLAVMPGMFLPQPVIVPIEETLTEETTEQQERDSKVPTATSSGSSSSRPSSVQRRNTGRRRQRIVQNSGKRASGQWVRKESGTES